MSAVLVSIARRRLVVLRLSQIVNVTIEDVRVSIARRRLVVLRLQQANITPSINLGVSIARRRLVVLRHRWHGVSVSAIDVVSIARRRLVVLRLELRPDEVGLVCGGFNRPKAISCLATRRFGATPLRHNAGFNRPKAISCLATCSSQSHQHLQRSFNRPKAISCLATLVIDEGSGENNEVSIARRRLVVLRRVSLWRRCRLRCKFQSPEGD